MKRKQLSESEKSLQDSLKARFGLESEKKLFRLTVLSPTQLRLAISQGPRDFVEYEFVYNDLHQHAWTVGARYVPAVKFQVEAVMYGGSTDNLDTRKKDALLMAVTMAIGMNECYHCDWPELLELAKRTPDKVAYGEYSG